MKVLIIQTAFIGDVVLATSLIDLVKAQEPDAQIDFLLRNGNEGLISNHPHIRDVLIWNKRKSKFSNLLKLALKVRKEKYDVVINIQRFFNSGLITALSGAKLKIGFKQNPLSIFFNKKINHQIPHYIENTYLHEVQRNALLYQAMNPNWKMDKARDLRPSIHPNQKDLEKIKELSEKAPYLVMAPASVWQTKQWPVEHWIELTKSLSTKYTIYFIGAPSDKDLCKKIIGSNQNSSNLCGSLSLVQSAALMKNATRVFVNDSAPLHLASAMDAKITAFFCSTIAEFGYFPISSDSKIISRIPRLECTPCGLHGKRQCPLTHFKCGYESNVLDAINSIE